MISIKDYAKSHGISYEAVRQQVSRYCGREIEGFRLSEHITKVDRTQYIDEEGVAFLDTRRTKNPVVIQQEERDETIERLRAQVGELQAHLIAEQDRYIKLIDEKHAIEMREQAMIADKQMIAGIKEEAARAVARAEEAEKAQKRAEAEVAKAQEEAGQLRASSEQQEKAVRDAKEEADRLREEAELLRTEVAEAEKAAEEAKSRADQMERAGLLARIFRSW